MVDNLSTYPEIMFLKTAHKEEITLQLLLHVYARYGAPEHVIMDNGANLKNGHVYSVLQMLGLKLADGVPKNDEGVKVNESVVRYTSAYNPQANTHAEFIQSQLIAAMRIMAEENGGDQSLWPYAIVMRLPSLRNKPRVNMTFSAHDMLYKRPLVSNFERITKANLQYVNLEDVGLNAHEDKVVFGGSERVLQAMHDITIMDDITAWELRESTEIRQNIVNTNRKEIVFRVGDLVGLKNNTQSDKSKGVASKMFVTHTGPYVIMNRYGKSYRLRKVDIIENNKTKYATRRVISEDGSSVMIADRNNVKEQVQVGRLIPWRQLRDIQPFRESPQDKMLKNLYTSDEKKLLSDHEAKHSEAYKELRKFMEHQWRRGASPEDSRGAYTFFSLKEEDGYTVHLGVGKITDAYVDWATGQPTVEVQVQAVQYFHKEQITTLSLRKDNMKEWEKQTQYKQRMLLTPTWHTANPEEDVTKRFSAKTALADPVKYASKLNWTPNLVQFQLSQLRGEMFGEESFVVADEDIRQLVEGGAIELSPQITMQKRIPQQAWIKLAQDERIVRILRTKLSKDSLEGTGAATRGGTKKRNYRQSELQNPESQLSRETVVRNNKMSRKVLQRRNNKKK